MTIRTTTVKTIKMTIYNDNNCKIPIHKGEDACSANHRIVKKAGHDFCFVLYFTCNFFYRLMMTINNYLTSLLADFLKSRD